VLVYEGTGYRWLAGLIPDGAGGAVLAWNDGRDWPTPTSWDVYVQRILPDGSVAPGWPPGGRAVAASPSSDWMDLFPSGTGLARSPTGGIFVAWHTGSAGDPSDSGAPGTKHFIEYDLGGTVAAGWPAEGRSIPGIFIPLGPIVTGDGSGGWFLAWNDSLGLDLNESWIMGVDSVGLPRTEFAAGPTRASTLGGVVGLVSDVSGGALLALTDMRLCPPGRNPFPYMDVYAQHVGADGEPLPGWPLDAKPVCTEYFVQQDIRIISDGSGGAYMAWEDNRNIDSTASDIYVQRITGAGDPAPGWPVAGLRVALSAQPDWGPEIVADGTGGVYLAYEEYVPPYRARAQHLMCNGQVHPNWPLGGKFITATPHLTGGPMLAPASGGNAFVAWGRNETGSPSIYCSLLSDEDITAVLVSLARVEATPEVVRLEWFASGDPLGVVTVERRSESSPWFALRSITPDGSGRIVMEDRDVAPGSRWAYRLAYRDGETPVTTPEAWVDVPAAFELSLTGFRPNPLTTSAWSVEFSLAQRGPGALEVFDVAGRRVARHDLAGFDPGRHLLRLDPAASWRAGVYWVRLSHSGRSFTARGVVAQ
jgi:hypothetical protein